MIYKQTNTFGTARTNLKLSTTGIVSSLMMIAFDWLADISGKAIWVENYLNL